MLEKYIEEELRCLTNIDKKKLMEICCLIVDTQRDSPFVAKKQGMVFVAGNGGSFLSACHFAEDVSKPALMNHEVSLPVIALGANPGLLQAIANDISWEDVFEFELKTFIPSYDNLLICLSVSGNSKNVIKACKYAKSVGMKTVAFVGFNGKGELSKLADVVVAIDSENFGIVEDVTMACLHNIAQILTRKE